MLSPKKIISSAQQHETYIQRLFELQRKAHRAPEETETAKLLIVLIADCEAKHFTIEKVPGVEVLKELMAANGLRQKDLVDDWGARVSCPWSSNKNDNSTGNRWKSLANAFTFLPQFSLKDLPTWKYT
jgi:antitoxin component HigA of HigAB toxin-antitoxin module